ncbi:MAG: glutaredoxin family protein [Clostridiales bacterium]|nr:glutaredoxin family protein [Clostridiales bacterium]
MTPTLKIYSTPGCAGCKMLVRHAIRKGVPYELIDVSKDAEALALIKDKGFRQAPVCEVNGEYWGGAALHRIDALATAQFERKAS